MAAIVGVVLVTDASDSEARTVRAAGISAQVPRGWHQRLPNDPIQLSVYTDAWFVGENCDAKTDYTTINVGVTSDPGRGPTPIPRPMRFDTTQGTGIQTGKDYADLVCGMTSQTITFTDNGQAWKATLNFARDAPPKRRAQAYRLLETLRLPKSN